MSWYMIQYCILFHVHWNFINLLLLLFCCHLSIFICYDLSSIDLWIFWIWNFSPEFSKMKTWDLCSSNLFDLWTLYVIFIEIWREKYVVTCFKILAHWKAQNLHSNKEIKINFTIRRIFFLFYRTALFPHIVWYTSHHNFFFYSIPKTLLRNK